jgi:PP-loop superfamily ATP-utilizing enzyme
MRSEALPLLTSEVSSQLLGLQVRNAEEFPIKSSVFQQKPFQRANQFQKIKRTHHATQPYAQISNRHLTDTKLIDSKELQRNPYWKKNTRYIKSALLI